MSAGPLYPDRFHSGDATGKQTSRFNQFSRHNPAPSLLDQRGTGMDLEADVACPNIASALLVSHADIAQEARKQRHMSLFVGGWQGVDTPTLLADQAGQLSMDIPPFAQAQR